MIKFQSDYYKKKIIKTRIFIVKNFGTGLVKFIESNNWELSLDLCKKLLNDTLTKEDERYLDETLGALHH